MRWFFRLDIKVDDKTVMASLFRTQASPDMMFGGLVTSSPGEEMGRHAWTAEETEYFVSTSNEREKYNYHS